MTTCLRAMACVLAVVGSLGRVSAQQGPGGTAHTTSNQGNPTGPPGDQMFASDPKYGSLSAGSVVVPAFGPAVAHAANTGATASSSVGGGRDGGWNGPNGHRADVCGPTWSILDGSRDRARGHGRRHLQRPHDGGEG